MSNFDDKLQELIEQAATCGKLFEMNNDETRFEKLMYFGEKLCKKEYMIGFAGHFSAGKSSMINALTGGDLLPSSPIPTSANIVKVRKAEEDYAILHLLDGKAAKYAGHRFSEAVKSFSKNGDAVSLIEIGHQQSTLPDDITVMDTPGVDSTDDRHRLATESALHLADLVFYTMDYNHVQSELNFTFTKELMRYNPNVYLIINQIDKHRESELPFEQFKQSVQESFNMWGVEPKGIFYTSLMEHDHPHNDFLKVKAIVDGAMRNWQPHFIENATQTLGKLKDEHRTYLQEKIEETKEQFSEVVLEDEWDKRAELIDEADAMEKTMSVVQNQSFAQNFDRARNELIQNAAITPYETRELLKSYLESLSSRFKVGFLFGAKKTEEARIERKKAFEENIKNLLHTQVEVHLRLLMKKVLKEANILTDERSLAIDGMDLSISLTAIEKQFQPADVITGDTILNYASQMKNNIQLEYRRLTDDWKTEMANVVESTGSHTSEKFTHQLQVLKDKIEAITVVDQYLTKLDKMDGTINNPPFAIVEARESFIRKWKEEQELHLTEEIEEEVEERMVPVEEAASTSVPTEENMYIPTDNAIEQAFHVADVLQGEDSFSSVANYLHDKASRLQDQSFTVALFGAFSAGKSSFSNALIGERILPVSPNPTTATINRIRPIMEGKAHGMADVILKTTERMTEDIIRSFEALNIHVTTLEEAFDKVELAMNAQLTDEKQQIHKAFITAFSKGYETFYPQLGEILHVSRQEFVRFVAEEERSCFVESIDFYYDCPLTRKGITLVDTPGADSINARHTDVAFDYIRNADAILFVTYYNHAFARADQEFLIQLGRVKDAFELDKMFFIVNAIDLAKDEEEANAVKSYVAQELQQFGIRHPRVHGLSSLDALEAKVENRPEPLMEGFEEEFHDFLEHDLKGMAVQGLQEETEKTIERLALLIKQTEVNRSRKAERLQELAVIEKDIQTRYESGFGNVLIQNALNESSELLHYVLQRVFLRFNDFFREAYNPSIFMQKSAEQALTAALNDLVGMVGFDVTQEMKVTNLRLLQFMTKQLAERQRVEAKALKELDETLSPIVYEPVEGELLSFEIPFPDATVYRSANKFYKNERSFFEKGDREKLKVHLEELLKNDTAIYLDKMKEQFEHWQREWIQREAESLQRHLLTECMNQMHSEKELLEEDEKLEAWRALYEKIQVKELV
ncbi:dynamin family protein [Sporosarcina ureilytica]|uniref:GTPase n=1 Tax=Sporosarcina ureilytica TaxID=298596 RepID=A0A1D8JGX4_9BACL|nr:dynamin family protein [Sporosarcina ureilytica]AOV07965.1 GTPase [Sporosarcina ureilytica]